MRKVLPTPKLYKTWQEWGQQLLKQISGEEEIPVLTPYALTRLPSAVLPTYLIIVEDEVGGMVPAFNDGTNWRRVTDRAIVS